MTLRRFGTRPLAACLSGLALLLLGPMGAGDAAAVDRFVETGGADSGDCSVTACLTLQYAIDQSLSGDTIHVAAGTYSVPEPGPPVFIPAGKTLILLGAQAGVDARTRVAAESILSNAKGLSVAASNVVIDGFTIQDSSNQAFTGYGIWLNPGVNGTQVVNNIFRNNIVGLGISNGGATQAVVRHNLFQDNNLQSVGAFGTGIYTDQYVSGAVSNVLIDENRFVNNDNAGIGFSSTDPSSPSSNVTITNNEIEQCGRGIYFYNTGSATVTHNRITDMTAPTDGGSSVGIGVFGAVSDLTIEYNDILGNILTLGGRGIRIGSFLDATLPNTNVEIHLNNIFGFAEAGMLVDDALGFMPPLVGSATFATCNWWGSVTGPTNPVLNPTGTGDAVKGTLVTSNFDPWLLGLAPDAPCGTGPGTVITACKYYDANADGIADPGDPPLEGWQVTIDPLGDALPSQTTQLTSGAPACVSWENLDTALNPYTVAEGTPMQSSWIPTTPASVAVTVVEGETSTVDFGNVCVGSGGASTIGYWGNKRGAAAIQACTGGTAGTLAFLSGLNLRNADGSDFDPTTYSALARWLSKAKAAKNMAYMLSAQLAGMELNVRCGGVDGSRLIYAPGTESANAAGFATVAAVMAEANAELAAHGSTPTGSPYRSYQEALKQALDRANNDFGFVQSTPCGYSFP